jgi:iron(III) transport system permease protein
VTWSRIGLFALTLSVTAVWLIPLVWLSWTPGGQAGEAARGVSLSPAAINSLLLALASAAAACILGGFIARLIGVIAARWRVWWIALFSLPLLLPAYLIAIAWAPLLSPSGMVVQPVSETPEFNARGFLSAVWIQCCAWYPIALLIFHASSRQWSSRYDEAMRVSGVHGIRANFLRLRWQVWPAVAAFAIVSLMVLAEFAVADYFGVRTLGTEIFAIVSAYLDPAAALAASRPLLVYSLLWILVLAIAANRVRRMARLPVLPGESAKTSRGGAIALVAIAACVLLVPAASLLITLASGSTPVGTLLWRALVLASDDIWTGLVVATAAALLAAGAAMLSARAAVTTARRSNAPRFVSVLALATPATIWAIGASTSVTAANAGLIWLVLALLIGMVLRVLAPSTEVLIAGLRNVPTAHVEAARVSGLSGNATWCRIVLPQIRVPLALSFCLAWIWSLNEVTLPVLLAPPGFSTLMLRIFQTVHYGPPELLAAYTLLHVSVIALAIGCVALLVRLVRVPI